MLLAKVPGEEVVVSEGQSGLASHLGFQAHLSQVLLTSPERSPGRASLRWKGKGEPGVVCKGMAVSVFWEGAETEAKHLPEKKKMILQSRQC